METSRRDGFPLLKQGWMIKNKQIFLRTKHTHTRRSRGISTQESGPANSLSYPGERSSVHHNHRYTYTEPTPVVLAICRGDLTWHQANKKGWVDWGDSGSFFTSGRVGSGEPDWIPRAREALRPLLLSLSQLLLRLRFSRLRLLSTPAEPSSKEKEKEKKSI